MNSGRGKTVERGSLSSRRASMNLEKEAKRISKSVEGIYSLNFEDRDVLVAKSEELQEEHEEGMQVSLS